MGKLRKIAELRGTSLQYTIGTRGRANTTIFRECQAKTAGTRRNPPEPAIFREVKKS